MNAFNPPEKFKLYTNDLKFIEKLTDNQAGKVFKLILNVVNGIDTKPNNSLLNKAIEPIINRLKKDIEKSNNRKEKRLAKFRKKRERLNKLDIAKNCEKPPHLQTDAFYEAWSLWCEHKKERGRIPTPSTTKLQIDKLATMGEAGAIKTIEYCVLNDYQGLIDL